MPIFNPEDHRESRGHTSEVDSKLYDFIANKSTIVDGIAESARENYRRDGVMMGVYNIMNYHTIDWSSCNFYKSGGEYSRLCELIEQWLYEADDAYIASVSLDPFESSDDHTHELEWVRLSIWVSFTPVDNYNQVMDERERERQSMPQASSLPHKTPEEIRAEMSDEEFAKQSPIMKLIMGNPDEWLARHDTDDTMRTLIDYDKQQRGEI